MKKKVFRERRKANGNNLRPVEVKEVVEEKPKKEKKAKK